MLLVAATLFVSTALHAEGVETPPLELLEYLGEWEGREGEWIDPQLLQLAMPGDGQQVNEEQNDE